VNLQLVANKEKKNGAQGGEDDASRMKSGIGRPRNMWMTAPPMIDPMIPRTDRGGRISGHL